MDHPTLVMKFMEWLKSVESVIGISVGFLVGWFKFLDTYLLADPSYWVVAAKATFTAVLTGLGAVIGTASGKWLISFIKTKLGLKNKNKPS